MFETYTFSRENLVLGNIQNTEIKNSMFDSQKGEMKPEWVFLLVHAANPRNLKLFLCMAFFLF